MRTFTLLFLLFQFSLNAQTAEDFEEFGKNVLSAVTDSVPKTGVDFIQMHEYHVLINRQPISDNQKSIMKRRVNDTYDDEYQAWLGSMKVLREDYEIERADGATFEYITTRHEPMEGSDHTYSVQTTFLYRNGKVQTRVRFNYDAAWITDRQEFVMLSELSEDF